MNLADMITTLPDADERAFMRLHYLNGHTIKDIAESINMTERNVYRLMKQARLNLERMYPDTFSAALMDCRQP